MPPPRRIACLSLALPLVGTLAGCIATGSGMQQHIVGACALVAALAPRSKGRCCQRRGRGKGTEQLPCPIGLLCRSRTSASPQHGFTSPQCHSDAIGRFQVQSCRYRGSRTGTSSQAFVVCCAHRGWYRSRPARHRVFARLRSKSSGVHGSLAERWRRRRQGRCQPARRHARRPARRPTAQCHLEVTPHHSLDATIHGAGRLSSNTRPRLAVGEVRSAQTPGLMQIPAALHPLLTAFTLDVPPNTWWATVDEYVGSESNAELEALAAEVESLSESSEEDAALGEALVRIGCYYWPGHGTTYRVWLQALAARLRERAAQIARRSRRRPPTFSRSRKKQSTT
jgi:hypothetical protein